MNKSPVDASISTPEYPTSDSTCDDNPVGCAIVAFVKYQGSGSAAVLCRSGCSVCVIDHRAIEDTIFPDGHVPHESQFLRSDAFRNQSCFGVPGNHPFVFCSFFGIFGLEFLIFIVEDGKSFG